MSARFAAETVALPREPIAIVGIGCRLPGGIRDAASFWEVLAGGVDAIGEMPPDRLELAPASLAMRLGGFLPDIAGFDAAFFGVSPREAERVDPQQRQLLEVAWEALEDAGIVPTQLAGSATGVFVGQWLSDYEAHLFADPGRVDFHMTLGSGRYASSGRISRALGLEGPSLTLDTACSSSLVAIHLACQSLWSGETTLALAGGANVILEPPISMAYGQSGMLAQDGRCKFGDAHADGYVRSEGVGVVVLEPLTRARALAHPIYASIRGSAVNNDGQTSGSFGTPGYDGQVALLRRAYAAAGVEPRAVQYVEAHGTGTRAGDPIELAALGTVLGTGRPPEETLVVGSVKTNLGHTEGAAGVAGLIKVALALKHGLMPPSLHCGVPTPAVAWRDLGVAVGTRLQEWRTDRPLLAGVSAFGIAGTNAHVVLAEAPLTPAALTQPKGVDDAAAGPFVLPLAAHTPAAVQALAASYAAQVAAFESSDLQRVDLATVCAAAALRRAEATFRGAVVGATTSDIHQQLSAEVGVTEVRVETQDSVSDDESGVVFVFPGQGGQWLGMGRDLLAREAAFAGALDDVARAFAPLVDWRLHEVLASDDPAWLARIDVVQPLLFAVQVGLAALWRSWGIEPVAVVGHSLGEVAAAYVAGGLTLDDAALVICRRSQLLRRISGQGAMAVVDLSEADAQAAIGEWGASVSVAVSNSVRSTVVAGDPSAMALLEAQLTARGVLWQWVKVDVASHSPQVEPILDDLRRDLGELKPEVPRVPFFSTVTGEPLADAGLDAGYWARNLREPVRFAAATRALVEAGLGLFIELSPHPVLGPAIGDTLRAAARAGTVLASLRRNEPELLVAYRALAQLYAQGVSVDWGAVMHRPSAPERVLPRYPWQHQRFWYLPSRLRQVASSASGGWLRGPFEVAADPALRTWTQTLSTVDQPFLSDHQVGAAVVLPAAGYIQLLLAAASGTEPPDGSALDGLEHRAARVLLEQVELGEALVLTGDAPHEIQLNASSSGATTAELTVYSRSVAGGAGLDEPWRRHATANRAPGGTEVEGMRAPDDRCAFPEAVTKAEHYARLYARQLPYGPGFQSVGEAWRREAEVLGRLELPAGVDLDAEAARIVLLDGCFQLLLTADTGTTADELLVPVAIERLTQVRAWQPSSAAWGYARVTTCGSDELVGDVQMLDAEGRVIVDVRGLRMRQLRRTSSSLAELTYELRWVPLPAASDASLQMPRPEASAPAELDASLQGPGAEASAAPCGRWLVLADAGGTADALIAQLERRGATCVRIAADAPLEPALAEDAGPWRGVVHARALDLRASDAGTLERVVDLGAGSALGVVQSLLAAQRTIGDGAPRLWLLTRGSQAPSTDEHLAIPASGSGVAQAPLWGFGRVVATEMPALRCSLVDLPPMAWSSEREAEQLAARLCADEPADGHENQLALRDGVWYALRLVHGLINETQTVGIEVPLDPGQGFALVVRTPGALDALALETSVRRPPAAGEIEIAISATGLNFLDVLKALGAYPGLEPGALIALGGECVGRVVAIGTGVSDFTVGDRVVAITPSFARVGLAGAYVTLPSVLAARAPASLSDTQAATLPLVFITAHYALNELGRVRPGERVLVHAAAGGVGLAAIQLIRQAGGEPLATAGSPAKREYLRDLGVSHVFDSRSFAFAPAVMDATGGRGVDVVLNSLAGAFIPASLGVLAPRGRFLEIGKRDIYADRRIGLEPFKRNLAFHGIDVAALVEEDPTYVGGMLREIVCQVEEGKLSPLPVEVYPVAAAEDAFRTMAAARHIGKLALDLRVRPATVRAAPDAVGVRTDASYVITGGLGALGLLAAGWLVDQGARHLLLLGRSEPSRPPWSGSTTGAGVA